MSFPAFHGRDVSYAWRYADWMIVLAALLVFGSAVSHDFVRWDDPLLITANPDIRGINLHTLRQAFSTFDPELYIPFTLISYQINYVIAGVSPWIYHLVNLLLHILNAVLVGRIILWLTGAQRGALVAAILFAIHPLQTEAVAWASARKDVLSTFFFLSSLLCFLRYRERNDRKNYYGSMTLFLAALLSKVSVVTMPVVLVLIDILEHRPFSRKAIMEKLPFFALSVAFGCIALFGKRDVASLTTPLELLTIAGKSTVFYLQKFLWPTGLSVIYQYAGTVSLFNTDILLSWILLIVLGGIILWSLRKTRMLFFGAAFYFLTLAPSFTNVVKGGEVYYASDRYVYIPLIGLLMLVAAGWEKIYDRRNQNSILSATCIVVLVLGFLSSKQNATWKNTFALFSHAVTVAPHSAAAHVNLGTDYRQQGKLNEATEEFNEALRIKEYAKAYIGLAGVKMEQTKYDEAIALLKKAQALEPKDPEPLYGIALAYSKAGRMDAAENMYRQTLALEPHHSGARNNLAAILLEQGKLDDARKEYETILKDDPTFAIGHFNLGLILEQQGDSAGAIGHYERAMYYEGSHFDVVSHLGPLLAKEGRYDEAVSALRTGLQLNATDPVFIQQVLTSLQLILEKDPSNKAARDLVQWMIERGLVRS